MLIIYGLFIQNVFLNDKSQNKSDKSQNIVERKHYTDERSNTVMREAIPLGVKFLYFLVILKKSLVFSLKSFILRYPIQAKRLYAFCV